MSEPCELIDGWLHTAADSADNGRPPDHLAAHIIDCPRCRMALITLLADRIAPAARPVDQPCALIEAQIPAFVDYERAHGLVAAARVFPDIWWHTLVCHDCDEFYRALHEITALPEDPWVSVTSRMVPRPAIQAQLQIHPSVMRQFLSARSRLGAHWGEQQDDVIIAEQYGEIGLIQVSLRQEPPASLALVIRTHPPIEGVVMLALGDTSYTESLNVHGCAIFSGIDQALFSQNNGQQITLMIRPPEF